MERSKERARKEGRMKARVATQSAVVLCSVALLGAVVWHRKSVVSEEERPETASEFWKMDTCKKSSFPAEKV